MDNLNYGVIVSGVSGNSHYWCDTRGCANRVRRVVCTWTGWTGGRTLDALVNLAAASKYVRTKKIIDEFVSN